MKYHAPTKSFVVNGDSYEMAALLMKCAIRHIRTLAGLPLEPHNGKVVMGDAEFAEASIIGIANALGIDLGTQRHGHLDVRDAP